MRRAAAGMSLIEVLVVLLSLTIVGSMAFQMLWENNVAVSRNLSQSSKADRLRILQKTLDQDLSSLYPNALEAGVRIDSGTGEAGERELLSGRLIESDGAQNLDVYEFAYTLEEYPEGAGRMALVRSLDPDLSPGRSPEADVRPVFSLEVDETLDWEVENTEWRGATSPSRLNLTLTNSRFKDFGTRREILIHGAGQP